MKSKEVLVQTFGQEIGSKLFGASVRLSTKYNIPFEDVVQDVTEAALENRAAYGYVNINITCKHAINAFMNSYRYGPTQYYITRGYGEIQETDREVGNFGDDWQHSGNKDVNENWFDDVETAEVDYDLRAAFIETLDTLSPVDRTIALGLMAEFKQTEIAQTIGRSNAFVSNSKKRLREAFSWAVA